MSFNQEKDKSEITPSAYDEGESYYTPSYNDGSYVPSNNNQEKEEIEKPRIFDEISKPKIFSPLQITIYFNTLYCLYYFFCYIIMFIYKGLVLPYPPNTIGPEVVAFFFFMIIQLIRIEFLNSGNKTQNTKYLLLSMILSIPVFLGYIYLVRYQTYCLVFDLGLNIFSIGFLSFEVLFSLIAVIKY